MEGFSKRFVELMYASGLFEDEEKPWKGVSYTDGSEIFDVQVNSFRNWCVKDMAPRKSEELFRVISTTLYEMGMTKKMIAECANYVCAYVAYGVVTEQSKMVMNYRYSKNG